MTKCHLKLRQELNGRPAALDRPAVHQWGENHPHKAALRIRDLTSAKLIKMNELRVAANGMLSTAEVISIGPNTSQRD
jgi:hypothetical protein